MTPILSKPYYRSELDLLPTKSTNPETTNWRCLMASEGNGFTHYLVSKEVVLGEACIIGLHHRAMQRVDLSCIHQARNRQAGSCNPPRLR